VYFFCCRIVSKIKIIEQKNNNLKHQLQKTQVAKQKQKKYHKMDLLISISINTPVEKGYTNVYV
jgi:hypothetical protein